MNCKSLSLSVFLCLQYCLLFSQERMESVLGKKVPNLQLEMILNYQKKSDELNNYRGKVVILDFWGTHCASCIKSFSHLEALQKEFKKDLQVFAVTAFDSPERIQRFLKKFRTTLPIVIDSTYILVQEFPHRSISHTVVIDKAGVVRAVSSPKDITQQVIENIIRGQPVNLEEKRDFVQPRKSGGEKFIDSEDSKSPEFRLSVYGEMMPGFTASTFKNVIKKDTFLIGPNQGISGVHKTMQGHVTWARILFETDGHSKTFFELEDTHKYRKWDKVYNVQLIAPNMDSGRKRKLLLDYFESISPLRSRKEKRSAEVWVLKRTTEELLLQPGDPSKRAGSMSGSGVSLKNGALSWLALFIEGFGFFGSRPVIDETGLKGKYQIELPYQVEDEGAFFKELRKIGLELVLEKRKVEMLILYEAKEEGVRMEKEVEG